MYFPWLGLHWFDLHSRVNLGSMFAKMFRCVAGEVTQGASHALHTGMTCQVNVESGHPCVGVAAYVARERSLSTVRVHVVSKARSLGEGHLAKFTTKRLGSRVNALVCSQRTRMTECLAADVTFIGTVSCVGVQVHLQLISMAKQAPTLRAFLMKV